MRSAPDEVKEKTKKKTAEVKSSFDYGSIFVLQSIMEELGLDRYLANLLPSSEVSMIRALAFNRIIRPTAMKNVDSWYEGTSLALESPQINLASQRVSELLCRLGESNIPDRFMSQLIEGTGTKNTIIYDITSLSSYSQLINLLEYGYNRDGESLPQINMSLILDKDKGIPVMYDIFPGSISDVSTLSGTLKKIKAQGIQNYVAVMDRGFFSLSNLHELVGNKISFVMAAKLQLNDLKQLMTEAQKDIDDVKYLHKFNNDPIFAKPITYNLDSNEVHGYVYYDPKLEQTEKQTLLSRLYDIREDLLKVRLHKNSNSYAVFKDKGDADLAFFPILGPCQPTELGKPQLGDAELRNSRHRIRCRISDTSWSIAYVVLPPGNLPGPGDSGSPLVQDGKVVGLLLSLNMHTCRGIAISAEMVKREVKA